MLAVFVLVCAICVDTLLVSLSYGTKKIRIPPVAAVIISVIGCLLLALSLSLAYQASTLLPPGWCRLASTIMLLVLGIGSISSNALKSWLRRRAAAHRSMTVHYGGVQLVLAICLDEESADADHSRCISPMEALYLGLALSLDSLAMGFGTGLDLLYPHWAVILALPAQLLSIWLGLKLGKLVNGCGLRCQWIGGVLLLGLAIGKWI